METYVFFKRASSFEALAGKESSNRDEHLAAARTDYTSARDLAPAWQEPSLRLGCLAEPKASNCVN
ncbi:hypothetical protein LP419_29405 [Massilia sp. H-1]|nr:hypothetical protein LP419_29405 [Massilia sp. H-1]